MPNVERSATCCRVLLIVLHLLAACSCSFFTIAACSTTQPCSCAPESVCPALLTWWLLAAPVNRVSLVSCGEHQMLSLGDAGHRRSGPNTSHRSTAMLNSFCNCTLANCLGWPFRMLQVLLLQDSRVWNATLLLPMESLYTVLGAHRIGARCRQCGSQLPRLHAKRLGPINDTRN